MRGLFSSFPNDKAKYWVLWPGQRHPPGWRDLSFLVYHYPHSENLLTQLIIIYLRAWNGFVDLPKNEIICVVWNISGIMRSSSTWICDLFKWEKLGKLRSSGIWLGCKFLRFFPGKWQTFAKGPLPPIFWAHNRSGWVIWFAPWHQVPFTEYE